MRLVLENHDGKAVRSFHVQGDRAIVISRKDTRRLEIHSDVSALEKRKVKFDKIGEFNFAEIEKKPFSLNQAGRLRLVTDTPIEVVKDQKASADNSSVWRKSLLALSIFFVFFFSFLLTRPDNSEKREEIIKQQVVQIVKKIPPPKPKAVIQTSQTAPMETKVSNQPKRADSIKRMGALSVLGSLKAGKQRGGIDLGAVNTTAGPGLGGTQGSGGVQTTLYGKGLVGAPVGAGSNMQGGGGYGTKGKGGGQAGYGKLSLIGSAGSAPIPLGREAIIDGGLDRDLIADVINRNMGQIRFCYEQGLQGDPALAGRVAINFTIGGNGTVKLAGVENTTLNSKLVEDCMVLRLKSWKFPLPEGGVDVKVSYPFVLRRAGQG